MRDCTYLDALNPEQRRAVEHGVEGNGAAPARPLLVIAGAGSGKTNTLAHRIAHLILSGADPQRILLLTFSRRAAAEMSRRTERIVAITMASASPNAAVRLGWSGTFHAIGARLLRNFAHAVGLDPGFTIHDREDSADLMNLVRHEVGLSDKRKRFPLKATCLAIYSRTVNAAEPLDAVLRAQFPWCAEWESELRQLFEGYVAAKQSQNVLDYDDLLLYWSEMLQVPGLAAEIGGLFDHVLVDEYQDTNALQAAILRGLKPDGRGLTVVGDDAQSIYSFRAATVRNILDFPQQFDPPARVLTLEQNYRSTQPILAASNAVIGLAKERFAKNLRSERRSSLKPALVSVPDETAQVAFVVGRILECREAGIPLKAQAVLFRTSHHSAMLEIELARRNIPFVKFGGLKFLEAAHVKDLLSVLRWVQNPSDRVSGFRVIQLMPGMGPAGAGKILDRIATLGLFDALAGARPPVAACEHWPGFLALLDALHTGEPGWPAELELARRWYQPHLEERYDDAIVRAGDLDQLEKIAAASASRQEFLTDLTLDPPSATSDEAGAPLLDDDYLILSTIHSAKGQEWKSVFVLNVVDGCIPSDMATGSAAEIEEERRLLYVAMTRAKDELNLVVPHRFYTHQQARGGDRHVYASRSRFIPAGIVDRFDLKVWPQTKRAEAPVPAGRAEPVDLNARMRGRWRATGS
ncbi:MAG: ATP-dependent helicase [Bacteroidota bacterium]